MKHSSLLLSALALFLGGVQPAQAGFVEKKRGREWSGVFFLDGIVCQDAYALTGGAYVYHVLNMLSYVWRQASGAGDLQ